MQKNTDNEEYKMPATIDAPTSLDEITEALEGIGLAFQREG